MRTTVTLDPDVVARLRAIMRERGTTFKAALNDALRKGLTDQPKRATPYRTKTRKLGLRPGINLDHALRFASELEDAEIIRKMELGK